MKVGLIDVDSKIPNLALMKISTYHKNNGDIVEFYNPMFQDWDLIYMSKVFNFTPDYQYPLNANKILRGGTGYDLKTKLPNEIENLSPDYNLYPNNEYAIGFTTRGCIRNCEFCVVPEKEGYIKSVADIYDFWEGQENLMLLDNNLAAENDHFERILKQMIKEKARVSFSQGLDIRLIDQWKAKLLSEVKLPQKSNKPKDISYKIHFAFDDVKHEKAVRKGIEILLNAGIPKYRLMFYVLIGFNSTKEEDLYRVELLRSLKVDPFVMPYNKSDTYQRNFTRWVNHKAIWRTVKWEDYRKTS